MKVEDEEEKKEEEKKEEEEAEEEAAAGKHKSPAALASSPFLAFHLQEKTQSNATSVTPR